MVGEVAEDWLAVKRKQRGSQHFRPCLIPGGHFFIRDDHPMFMAIGEDVSDGLRIEQPYFQREEPLTWEDEGSYVDAADPSVCRCNLS